MFNRDKYQIEIPDYSQVTYDIRELPDIYIYQDDDDVRHQIARIIALMTLGPLSNEDLNLHEEKYCQELEMERSVRISDGLIKGYYKDGHIIEIEEVSFFGGLADYLLD